MHKRWKPLGTGTTWLTFSAVNVKKANSEGERQSGSLPKYFLDIMEKEDVLSVIGLFLKNLEI